MFSSTGTAFSGTSGFGTFGSTSTTTNTLGLGNLDNPMKDLEVQAPPDDTVSAMKFSPKADFLIASSWANDIRCWEVKENGQTIPKAQQSHTGPILDCCWHDDGTKVFTASTDKQCKMWDLNSNQAIQVAQHDKAVKTCHWVQAPNYSCLMTGSWDQTLKFWDTRSPNPMLVLQIPERVYCADVVYPMAIVGTAQRGIICYQLENQPSEYKRIESPLKYQNRCVSIFRDPKKNNNPVGFALGSVEGRVAIQFIQPQNPKDNFTFKCHRSNGTGTTSIQDIFAVNDIAFHPVHFCLLATVGSDGKFSFWDKDARTKLKTSEQLNMPITACCFNSKGNIFAYTSSYDWSKGHEFYNPQIKPKMFLRNCLEELKPRKK